MEPRLVYRALRKLSDWALTFYSEVDVSGGENVPDVGPLIVVSCHHNEILDIATLAVTIPHRRPLCFWAKSTLFKNPVSRAILLSSGSIPVRRNPNSSTVGEGSESGGLKVADQSRQTLFRETFRALDSGEVVGVFPEGTSYTEPRIVQVKEGAAWAALEYVRWQRESGGASLHTSKAAKLLIVPVGIVHTDKTEYQSRVGDLYGACGRAFIVLIPAQLIRLGRSAWGAPIDATDYVEKHLYEMDGDPRAVVKSLTREIERRMVELTINAPNWETLHVARMAAEILWSGGEHIPMQKFTQVCQSLIDIFSQPNGSPSTTKAKEELLKYYSFSYYTSISHSSLVAVFPETRTAELVTGATSAFFKQLAITLVHPRFLFFLPPFLLHVPAYILALLGKRALASPQEKETHAQFKAVFGVLGAGIVYSLVGKAAVRAAASRTSFPYLNKVVRVFGEHKTRLLQVGSQIAAWLTSRRGILPDTMRLCGAAYGAAWILSKWHNALVGSNYRQLKRLITSFKVLIGVVSPGDLPSETLDLYAIPPRPPVNPFIKNRSEPVTSRPSIAPAGTDDAQRRRLPVPSTRQLIRPLLVARAQATSALTECLRDPDVQHAIDPMIKTQFDTFLAVPQR